VDRDTLSRLEHDNMIATITAGSSNVPGSLVRREDGVALALTGLPIRLFNQVVVESDGATESAVEAGVTAARERGDRFAVNLRLAADDRLIPLLTRLGLVPLSEDPWMPGMALHPIPTDRAASRDQSGAPEHEIRQIADVTGINDHVVTAAAGFEMPEALLSAIMGPALTAHPDVAIYVGYVDGRPVSTGLGFRTDRTIGVYNIATVPDARRRGYGAAMTERIAADGAAAGCDVAILQASPMGLPIYERLGYRTVVEYMAWVDPEPPTGP
jgi:GNAT superfamily N-acetyltransferase